MAYYKYDDLLIRSDRDAYDCVYEPGAIVPYAGIYRCIGCGREVTAGKGHFLPLYDHHQHATADAVQWRLAIYADPHMK